MHIIVVVTDLQYLSKLQYWTASQIAILDWFNCSMYFIVQSSGH